MPSHCLNQCWNINWTLSNTLEIHIEIFIEIPTFSFRKIRLKVSSAKCRPYCLGLNVISRYLSGTVIQVISTRITLPIETWFTLLYMALSSGSQKKVTQPACIEDEGWTQKYKIQVEYRAMKWKIRGEIFFGMKFCFYFANCIECQRGQSSVITELHN